jgi:hypothetical protein
MQFASQVHRQIQRSGKHPGRRAAGAKSPGRRVGERHESPDWSCNGHTWLYDQLISRPPACRISLHRYVRFGSGSDMPYPDICTPAARCDARFDATGSALAVPG